MSILADMRILWSLLRGQRGNSHRERLESFYEGQADEYDRFRKKLLHGRQELIDRIPAAGHLIEFGGGTGCNLLSFGNRLRGFSCVELVDLCQPLLDIAHKRCEQDGWERVCPLLADACTWQSQRGQADCCLFSYSLTMIPNWFAAIDNALAQLKPGGIIAVVDFHLARKHPDHGLTRHSGWTRHFWPWWFSRDGVRPNQDLLPYLRAHSQEEHRLESRGSIPYLPGLRVPWFSYIGVKK